MDVSTVMERTGASVDAKRVFAEPVESGGATVICAAMIGGGGGGAQEAQASGSLAESPKGGAGFARTPKPAGAFVIREGRVRWQPAVDLNRVILGAQLVAGTGLLLLRALAHSRQRAPRRWGLLRRRF
jgi:uncharacterized spore protein YtfJ